MLTGLFVCPARVSLLLRVGGRSTCVLRSKQKFGHLGRLTSKVALYHCVLASVPRHHALHTHFSDGLPSNLSSVSVCSTSLKAAAPTRPMLFRSKLTSLRCLRSLSAPLRRQLPRHRSCCPQVQLSNFSKRRKEPARSRISLSVQSKYEKSNSVQLPATSLKKLSYKSATTALSASVVNFFSVWRRWRTTSGLRGTQRRAACNAST